MSTTPPRSETTVADIWVDPRCPWAWITSRWMLEVEQVRPLETRFHIMSLSVLNEGREVPEKYRQGMIDGWACVRVCVAAQQRHGNEVLRPLYNAMGRLIHHDKAGLGPDMISAALAEAGLPADLTRPGRTPPGTSREAARAGSDRRAVTRRVVSNQRWVTVLRVGVASVMRKEVEGIARRGSEVTAWRGTMPSGMRIGPGVRIPSGVSVHSESDVHSTGISGNCAPTSTTRDAPTDRHCTRRAYPCRSICQLATRLSGAKTSRG
ncbi:hypothetical protein SMICM17S_08081 [Streptomyces microflavus]